MTANQAEAQEPEGVSGLLPGASPQTIRAALLPEDRAEFESAYDQALLEARESLDLTELFDMLEHWRRLAVLQSDPGRYRRVVRRAAELQTDEAPPEDEPLAVTRAKVGL